jgi:hypothetical protein
MTCVPRRADVLGALAGLVDKSVVLRTDAEQARYRLLDTIYAKLGLSSRAQLTTWLAR